MFCFCVFVIILDLYFTYYARWGDTVDGRNPATTGIHKTL